MQSNHRTLSVVALTAALAAALTLSACGGDQPEKLVESAKGYLAKNDPNAAVIQLKNALQKNPEFAEARFLLGKTALTTGDIPTAEKELRRAYELKYAPDQVVPLLASAVVQMGEPKKMIEEFAETKLGTPEANAALLASIGSANLALNKTPEAIKAFSAAVAMQPGNSEALLGQARIKALNRDLPGALALVGAALESSPRSTDAWQLKGDILVAQGLNDEALVAYRKTLETRPDYLPAHFVVILQLLQQGKTDEAKAQLDVMQKIAPKHPQTYYLQALLAYRQSDFQAARNFIQQQLASAPDNVPGLVLSGSIDYELKSYESAEATLSGVLKRAPQHLFARRVLAATYMRTNQPARALETIRPALEGAENDPSFLTLAGEIFFANGKNDEATKLFERATAIDPKNAPTRTALALSHMASGDVDRGFKELEASVADDPTSRSDLALIGANIKRRDFAKALAAIDGMEKKDPNNPLVPTMRGEVENAKGDRVAARKSFERALTLNPAYLPAANNLARLDLADKKPDDARKRFESVLAKEPKNMLALLALAQLRLIQGAPNDEIADLLGKAIVANPTAVQPRVALVGLYLKANDTKKAVIAGQDALLALPNRPEVMEALARAQIANGEANQAVATYNKWVQLQPSNPIALLRVGEAQQAAKDNDGAMQTFKKALALKPDLVDAQRRMAGIEASAGRTAQAISIAREVQKQRPKESIGYILEGDIYALKKAWPDAVTAYRAGLKVVGSSDLAVRLHASLAAAGGDDADKFASSWLKDHPTDVAFLFYTGKERFSAGTIRWRWPTSARSTRSIRTIRSRSTISPGSARRPKIPRPWVTQRAPTRFPRTIRQSWIRSARCWWQAATRRAAWRFCRRRAHLRLMCRPSI